MSVHSTVVGGSSAERRIQCLGSLQAEAAMPDPGSSEAADEGTACHHAMEFMLNHGLNNPWDLLGKEFPQQGRLGEAFTPYEMDEERIATKIEPAWKALEEIYDEFGPPVSPAMMAVEPKVHIDPEKYGFVDLCYRAAGKRVVIVDWKFGFAPVQAKHNYQIQFYGAATMLDRAEKVAKIVKGADSFALCIVQPLSDPTWSYEVVDRKKLNRFASLLNRRIKEAQESKKPPRKTGRWCKYCRALPVCDTYQAALDPLLHFEPEGASEVDLAEMVEVVEMAEVKAKAFRAFFKQQMEAGVSIPGWKLTEGRRMRYWSTDEESIEREARKLGLDDEQIFKKKLRSISQFEQLKLPSEKISRLQDLTVTRASGLSVARESSPKPAVTPQGTHEDLAALLAGSIKK